MTTRIPTSDQVKNYLARVFHTKDIKIHYFGRLDEYSVTGKRKGKNSPSTPSIKTLGYGIPYLVVYDVGERQHESIISTMRIGQGFGHDFRSDRIDNLFLSYDTWNNMPQHCRVQDIGAFDKTDSSMTSLGRSGEFFLLRQKITGIEYYKDLDRILTEGKLGPNDESRARELAKYLVKIHSKKNGGHKELYVRKIRDTVGHGECIFGLADSYPAALTDYLEDGELEAFEEMCVKHRWKLKGMTQRLCQVHGDFHPWNILFSNENSLRFKLLDRSRGEWGEAADDVCGLSINYIFYSLRKYEKLAGPFEVLFHAFVDTYLKETNDLNILEAMPLFYAFRALVIASPLWYPTLSTQTRRQIFNFAENVLIDGKFDPHRVNEYIASRPKI